MGEFIDALKEIGDVISARHGGVLGVECSYDVDVFLLADVALKNAQLTQLGLLAYDAINGNNETFIEENFISYICKELEKIKLLNPILKHFRKNNISLMCSISFVVGVGFQYTPDNNQNKEKLRELACEAVDKLAKYHGALVVKNAEMLNSEKDRIFLQYLCECSTKLKKLPIILEYHLPDTCYNLFGSNNVHLRSITIDKQEDDNVQTIKLESCSDSPKTLPSRALIAFWENEIQKLSESAIRLLCCIAANPEPLSKEELMQFFSLENEFENALCELFKKQIIRYCGTRITLFHPNAKQAIFSGSYSGLAKLFGCKKIIDSLENKENKTPLDRQRLLYLYLLEEEHEKALRIGVLCAYDLYLSQNYNELDNLLKTLFRRLPKNDGEKLNLILLQSVIRKGGVKIIIPEFSEEQKKNLNSLDTLLLAERYYLYNHFLECTDILRNHRFESSREKIIADGILCATYIAQGKHQDALNLYNKALLTARNNNEEELELELLRLSPELTSAEQIDEDFNRYKNSPKWERYPYLYAKWLHNYAVFYIFSNKYEDAANDLKSSADIFKQGNYIEYSYSAICLSALSINKGAFDAAACYLDSAEYYLHEIYDRFCWFINKAIVKAHGKSFKEALAMLEKAYSLTKEETFHHLNDPYFVYILHWNRFLINMEWKETFFSSHYGDAAHACMSQIDMNYAFPGEVPSNCFLYKNKVARNEEIKSMFDRHEHISLQALRRISDELKIPLYEVATLQFFDFNVNALPPNFMSPSVECNSALSSFVS